MPAKLKEYRAKRDFQTTPEPSGKASKSASGSLYIVQKHAARRLHYDFRLELDGVLLSWAIPKGPSLTPGDRRLAVQTEDHPIEYGSFEGIIPEGEYGGGTVMLWDRGSWEPLGDAGKMYKDGKLTFKLHGEKLRGQWKLVRMRGSTSDGGERNWLLIKSRDEEAKSDTKHDITEAEPLSVISGRTIDEIAEQRDTVWTNGQAAPLNEPIAREPPSTTRKQPTRSKSPAKKERASRKESATKLTPAGGVDERDLDPSQLPGARKRAQPTSLEPELATLVKTAPEGDDWIHEIKYDGYRLLIFLNDGKAKLITRQGNNWTSKFKSIADVAAKRFAIDSGIIDGEVVVLDKRGVSSFQSLQNALKQGAGGGGDGARSGAAQLIYYAFDLPHCLGYDLTRTPLISRKAHLQKIIQASFAATDEIRYSDHIHGRGEQAFHNACRLALEGVVSKRIDSQYESKRTRDWVKVKCSQRQEFVVGGFTDPSGSRAGFGSLLLGYYDDGALIYSGRVGAGFKDEQLNRIHQQVKKLERRSPVFHNPPRGADAKGVHWIEPRLVAEVEFTEWTNDGILRHPTFQGLREDKDPRDVGRELPAPTPNGASNTPSAGAEEGAERTSSKSRKKKTTKAGSRQARSPARSGGRASTTKRKKARATSTRTDSAREGARKSSSSSPARDDSVVAGVRLSNPDRILYPEQRITKAQLARYYESIAEWALPFMTGRLLTLVRCPRGRQEKCFYQKHHSQSVPKHVRGVDVLEKDKKATYLVIDDLSGLISLVQMGVLELHPWGGRIDKIERPDMLIIDLDPGPGVSWAALIDAAVHVRDRLRSLSLESFVRTTGGKGLHVVIPIQRRTGWDDAKKFTKAIADLIVRDDPAHYIATMSKAKRSGKVFIDYLRNARGATAIASYSTRARPRAPVATPLAWEELNPSTDLREDYFNIDTVQQRLGRLKRDPWAKFWNTSQTIKASTAAQLG